MTLEGKIDHLFESGFGRRQNLAQNRSGHRPLDVDLAKFVGQVADGHIAGSGLGLEMPGHHATHACIDHRHVTVF